MSQQNPVLGVYNLSKVIRGKVLVDHIEFEVFPGEVFGFLGPNGAGKTTAIRMMVGLVRPTTGRIVVDGFDLKTQYKSAISRIGCIVENPDLYPYLSGYENLLLLARMHRPHAMERIDSVVKQVGLEGRIHDGVRTYSLGMRQRLGIAQALLPDPKLLILDEPTNGLDPAGIHEFRNFIRSLAGQGKSVIVSSHLLSEVQAMCDRVAIIRDGKIIETGGVRELMASAGRVVVWRVLPKPSALRILGSLVGNGACTAMEDGTIECGMDDLQIPGAIASLTQAGCQVYEVTRKRASLEDVFLRSTGGVK